MSRGPGSIEGRIADLFAATRDHALDIETVTRHAFELRPEQPPTRVQRLSATRAAHRVLRRVRDAHARAWQLIDEAERVGTWAWSLRGGVGSLGAETDFWQVITLKGRLYFHPPDVPMQVWAVTIDRDGVHWFPAEVIRVTARNVAVRYRGEVARLDRQKLWRLWAWWRGVRFVSSRTGRIAAALDEAWWKRFGTAGAPPPAMRMPLDQARQLLGVPENYTKDDVVRAFRRAAMKAHPDQGGTPEMFRLLVEARDRLLAALGTSAPPPKPPDYAPKGVQVVYRVGKATSQQRLGSGPRRLTASRP
jgi:hypothetical protein